MIFSCQSCGRAVERDATGGADMAGLWTEAMGWTSPAGPCPACAGDPIVKQSWSWSKLQQFETCPEKFRATTVDRTHVEPKSEAMLRGSRVHEQFEAAIKKGSGLPPDYHHLFPFVQQLRQIGAVAEQKLALNANLSKVGYFDRDTWLRVVVDTHVVKSGMIAAVDWKTGRHKSEAFDQLRLIGAALLFANPHCKQVDSRFVWVDEGGEPDIARLDLRTALKCMIEMRGRVAKMVTATLEHDFPVRPCWACRFCPVDECRHNKNR
jgi:hypothetical protein